MTHDEKRDATLRTVQLPDCCGNCQHWDGWREQCGHLAITDNMSAKVNQLCDLHARKPDGGNG